MKKHILIFVLILLAGVSLAFAESDSGTSETKEFRADLNLDGTEDLFIEESSYTFENDENEGGYVLKIRIAITIKLLNKDCSVKKEITFRDDRDMYDDEYDGGLGYSVKDNMIVRSLVTGRHSWKDYEDRYFSYDKQSDNWKLVKKTLLEAPMHTNKLTETTFEDETIYLFNKDTHKYSGF